TFDQIQSSTQTLKGKSGFPFLATGFPSALNPPLQVLDLHLHLAWCSGCPAKAYRAGSGIAIDVHIPPPAGYLLHIYREQLSIKLYASQMGSYHQIMKSIPVKIGETGGRMQIPFDPGVLGIQQRKRVRP